MLLLSWLSVSTASVYKLPGSSDVLWGHCWRLAVMAMQQDRIAHLLYYLFFVLSAFKQQGRKRKERIKERFQSRVVDSPATTGEIGNVKLTPTYSIFAMATIQRASHRRVAVVTYLFLSIVVVDGDGSNLEAAPPFLFVSDHLCLDVLLSI